jgi:hypothetical protein
VARSYPSRSSRPGVYRPPSRVYFGRRRQVVGGSAQQPGRAVLALTARQLSYAKTATIGRAVLTFTAQQPSYAKSHEPGLATATLTAQAVTGSTSPGGTLLPELIVEVAFNVGAATAAYLTVGDATRGLLGTGTVAPDDAGEIGGVWTDISDYVISGTLTRGSSRVDSPVVSYEAGTVSLTLDNSGRRFDPTHLSGPYVSAGVTQITPMRAVRVRAVWNNAYYDLFRGYADAWDIDWRDPGWSTATLTATDGFKVLAGIDRAASVAAGAGEDSGARIGRILDDVDWPAVDRDLDTGDVTLQATTLEGEALAELRLTADSELGELYVDGGGRLVFRRRGALAGDDRSAISQAVFGDGAGELPYQDLAISNDDATLFNKVRITRAGGAEQTASDATSIAVYRERTFERSDLLLETDGAALTYAQAILARTAEPELRFESLGVDPRRDPGALYPHALGRELGDRITIVRRPPGGGQPITRDVWIRGIEHAFEPMAWRTTWTFQAAIDGLAPPAVPPLPAARRIRHVAITRSRPWHPRPARPLPPARLGR